MTEGSRKVQYAAAFCATLTMVYQGIILGWPSPMIPKLLSGQAGISITKEQCSWVASLVAFGAAPGCLISQYLVDKIGRKKCILFVAIPCIIGSIMTIFVSIPILLYISRFISGLGSSMAVVAVSMYLGEISDKQIRGFLGTLLTTMANLGNLLMYAIGPFVSYTTLNWICLSVPVLFLVSCLWIPESPYFHLKMDRFDDAAEEMMKLKSLKSIEPIKNELIEIQKNVKHDMEKKTSIKELLVKQEYRRAVIILGGLKILQQMTGTLVIQSYLETLLIAASMNISGATGSVIYGVVQLIAGIVSAVLVDKMGRKPLLFISSLGTGMSLTVVGIYFYIQQVLQGGPETMSSISWMPITGLVGFNILYAIGLGNLPYVLQSEIFPTNVKSAASSIATIFGAMMAATITKMYQGLVDSYGIHSVFWMFAAVSYIGVLFVFFVVPETKGKTLEEIQRKLNNKRYIAKAEEDSKEMEVLEIEK